MNEFTVINYNGIILRSPGISETIWTTLMIMAQVAYENQPVIKEIIHDIVVYGNAYYYESESGLKHILVSEWPAS